jgi:hypothetical protein
MTHKLSEIGALLALLAWMAMIGFFYVGPRDQEDPLRSDYFHCLTE